MPLAIELAAARVRTLSPAEIVESLHDRFRLLTGGSRTAVRRQQTLRASVDWSHALLTQPEQTLFRRLAVFVGGFDLEAVRAVIGHEGAERYQVLDQLALLVDKSLVVADEVAGSTRYRLLETVRQYAQEKLGESGEADVVRSRHRDYYAAMAALLDAPADCDYEGRIEQAETEIDNLRAAFAWSRENSDVEQALSLASSLQPLWSARGHIREGLAWHDAALADLDTLHAEVAPIARARALADRAVFALWVGGADTLSEAQEALAIAREVDDPTLLARTLTACGQIAALSSAELAEQYFTEGISRARALDDRWRLSQLLACQAAAASYSGDPFATRAPAEEGRDLAEAIGDRYCSRLCRWCLGYAQLYAGQLNEAAAQFRELVPEARAAHDRLIEAFSLAGLGTVLRFQRDLPAARATAEMAVATAAGMGGIAQALACASLGGAALAAGDVATAREAITAWPHLTAVPGYVNAWRVFGALTSLAEGDLVGARGLADEAAAATAGYHRSSAMFTRARLAIAEGEPEQAERDAQDALASAADAKAYLHVPDILDHLADLAARSGGHREAVRLFGAAHAIRDRAGAAARGGAEYDAALVALREALGEASFESGWSEGDALSVEEAIAYARRGRGGRKRAATGWGALTPTELDVAKLVSEGLGNKEIAARLFVSPRTVQSHLTHVYAKLSVTSRMQLAREAARHSGVGQPRS